MSSLAGIARTAASGVTGSRVLASARGCFVAGGELSRRLPLSRAADQEQKPESAMSGPVRSLGLRETRSDPSFDEALEAVRNEMY
jgi:hypothetical protein